MESHGGIVEAPRGLAKFVRLLTKSFSTQVPKQTQTTTVGIADASMSALTSAWFDISTERVEIYDDAEEMEDTIDEVAVALDVLADEAVNSEMGAEESFRVVWESGVSKRVQKYVEDSIAQCRLAEKMYGITRDTLLYGDNFQQYILGPNLQLVRVMHMPPNSMVRNEDEVGLLLRGSTEGNFAFEQYVPRTNKFIAGFRAWQVEHIRWNRRGSSPYGRSMCYTARHSWRKLKAMEEALCVNWLTRAFARLLFKLDVTGKTEKEATAYIQRFKRGLTQKKVVSGVLGDEELSVVKDLFIGKGFHDFSGQIHEGLTDVSVLDTASTGFTHLDPVEYYQNKILTSMRVPKAYLGLERDINAKATLSYQDRRFARTIRRVQSVNSGFVHHFVALTLLLKGINPRDVQYVIEWPNPSRLDVVEEAQALQAFASAAQTLVSLGVVDDEYIAAKFLQMTPAQWTAVADRVKQKAQEVVDNGQPTDDTDDDDTSGD